MHLSDFDYALPQHNIALFPPEKRGTTRLLVLNRASDQLEHRSYEDLVDYIKPGDVVVLNDTKVIKARLLTYNKSGQLRELLLLESHQAEVDPYHHRALYRGTLHSGELLIVDKTVIRVDRVLENGIVMISSKNDMFELSEIHGHVPLPPYIKRGATDDDMERYQTVFARSSGSVAAPTASLNFTDNLKRSLEAKGAVVVYLTLHVGLGTFLPIRTDNINEHVMHSEYFEIPAQTIAAIQMAKQAGHHIIAVGTTVARTLEYAAQAILYEPPHRIRGEADIFIYPGCAFKVIDKLMTNFHAPHSTVLMLAAAFTSWDKLKQAYIIAIENDYRFLSYGDSMLIY